MKNNDYTVGTTRKNSVGRRSNEYEVTYIGQYLKASAC